jgi:hypothetical protein
MTTLFSRHVLLQYLRFQNSINIQTGWVSWYFLISSILHLIPNPEQVLFNLSCPCVSLRKKRNSFRGLWKDKPIFKMLVHRVFNYKVDVAFPLWGAMRKVYCLRKENRHFLFPQQGCLLRWFIPLHKAA